MSKILEEWGRAEKELRIVLNEKHPGLSTDTRNHAMRDYQIVFFMGVKSANTLMHIHSKDIDIDIAHTVTSDVLNNG